MGKVVECEWAPSPLNTLFKNGFDISKNKATKTTPITTIHKLSRNMHDNPFLDRIISSSQA
jgi:hypothetical protein